MDICWMRTVMTSTDEITDNSSNPAGKRCTIIIVWIPAKQDQSVFKGIIFNSSFNGHHLHIWLFISRRHRNCNR